MSLPLIMLVEDEHAIQRATATLLRSRGYAVTVAGTGSEALSVFDRDRPSLVILDLGLPDIDGTVVCQELRNVPMCRFSSCRCGTESAAKLKRSTQEPTIM